jgi:ABC-2 type transport system ATP-binding protein
VTREVAIDCAGVVRRFGAFIAVDDLSLEVFRGEVFGLLGANGCGKSTTIRMLTGILPPTAGRVEVAGVDVVAAPLDVRTRIGYVAQKVSLYPNLRVEDNLAFYGGIYGLSRAEIDARVRPRGLRLGLDATDRRAVARDLPAGVRQRLAILLALLHRPPVVFLDEPTAGVDLANRRELFDLLHELAGDGTALFITSHHLDEMERCDRLAFMDRGQLLACGRADDLKASLGGGRRFLVQAEPCAGLAARLCALGFRSEAAGAAGAYVLVAGEREEAALADALPRLGGRPSLTFDPPPLEAIFSKVVAERRRESSAGRPTFTEAGP